MLWFGDRPIVQCKYSPAFKLGMRPKRSFETRMKALMRENRNDCHRPYKCTHCGMWHLSSK